MGNHNNCIKILLLMACFAFLSGEMVSKISTTILSIILCIYSDVRKFNQF
jgi:hypothetical protein